MAFFDFVKDVGANLFGKGKKEDEEVKALLTKELGDKITDLKVTFADGTIVLSGSCDSQATKEKAVLLAGNIKGVAKVDDEQLTTPHEEEVAEFYTIKSGDTLSKIAKHYYGNAMKYPVIFEANREVIKDANLIYPGQRIRIPKIS